jgi:hypothetical protein
MTNTIGIGDVISFLTDRLVTETERRTKAQLEEQFLRTLSQGQESEIEKLRPLEKTNQLNHAIAEARGDEVNNLVKENQRIIIALATLCRATKNFVLASKRERPRLKRELTLARENAEKLFRPSPPF